MITGLISDTHDLLRSEAIEALAGVDRILHAGDVCSPGILESLEKIAPVQAVRGNCDGGAWADRLPRSDCYEIDGITIYAVHDIETIDIDPVAAKIDMVLYGHSHIPLVQEKNGVLMVNPGSAGPRRFRLPVTLARMRVVDGRPEVEPITLEAGS